MKKYIFLVFVLLVVFGIFLLLKTSPTPKEVKLSNNYSDAAIGLSFSWPADFEKIEENIAKKEEKNSVLSIQFLKKDEKKNLPFQFTIIKPTSTDLSDYNKKIAEIKKYYTENGKKYKQIGFNNSQIELYKLEEQEENRFIEGGYYVNGDKFIVIAEYFHYNNSDDSDLFYQIIESFRF
ncbi:MAG: hypothetical protein Athens101428_390 [Candidatus Berkelbacteria bacterium Athens1014_28]|uniref:Uncharacterized protein n=1 Tax=Candidatus Berkelbacteria bacterium Athens1014_28 TaxID=2017145 RepID=A0A554LN04_9BACT|nr:MAG: hypothetical protein Athens101428_390 [Candidatus Berkelbacteria bacterium Athens1014_28]